ncbi:hypothetical protein K0040_12720 [Terrisporobacter petrolearius]|uniref:hypothetical protein n=1 Tax=Terrisporobacter petrolearius TaxID=1460447 RepID=UPI001D16C2A3|nr:hypothetical protein [Terrisporobacter petrolearius]MCC3865136.1 hypothetical protein [Terrisporobacter petrolearius]
MKNITKEEKILYLILIAMFSMFTIDSFNKSSMELYNLIFNHILFTFFYVPAFLYILLKRIKNISLPEILIRYESIDDLIIHRIKILIFLCLRVSIFFIIFSNLFLILKDINIIFYKEFWLMNVFSIGTQFIGWFFVGLIYLFFIKLFKHEILVYTMEIFMLASMIYILSPTALVFLKKYIRPIWEIMYFYDFNINMQDKVLYINLTIIINVMIIYLYKYLLKSKDIRR